ncbi:MAG: hypothetical protein WC341_17215 [Bacteroidales bacterium]|jgi:hypothetical protein
MSNDYVFTNQQLLKKLVEKIKNARFEFECPNTYTTCNYVEDLVVAAWDLAHAIQPIIDKFSMDQDFHINQERIDGIQVLINKLRGATPGYIPATGEVKE